MKRRIPIFGILIILIGISFTPLNQGMTIREHYHPIVSRDILYVGGSGPNNYTSIQDAIDDASDGDTVFVYDESSPYPENLLVDKSINLLGEDKNTTEIISNWEEFYVINISSDFVNISGFTIRAEGFVCYGFVGISIVSCNNKISDNIITAGYGDNEIGLELLSSSENNIIIGNIFMGSSNGIYSTLSSNNIIQNNYFTCHWDCIVLDLSHGNSIINNTLNGNSHGIILYNSHNNILLNNRLYNDARCTTLYLLSSNNNTIKDNIIFWGNSINMRYSHNNTINGNTIAHCWYGISLWNTSYNKILCNNFISCWYGISCGCYFRENYRNNLKHSNCCYTQNYNISLIENKIWFIHGNNTFYHNNFINNSQNANDSCNDTWDDGYPSGGNYWDDYTGYDNNGDGIGDTPYPIPGGENTDRYPLMEPLGIIPNLPPYPPRNYYPHCGWTVYDDVNLSWDGGDPDSEDMVTYDVYFGTHNPPPLIATIGPYPANQTRIEYNPGPIECRKYYWKIVAWDGKNIRINGYTCDFEKEGCNYPPNKPEIDGSTDVSPGTYQYSFKAIDPDNDNVYLWIEWGDGTSNYWFGPYNSGEIITVNHSWYSKGCFLIKCKASDVYGAESEWGEMEVNIPRSRTTSYLWFLDHFPMLERLLELINFSKLIL